MASKKKKKEIPSVFEVLDRRRNEQIAQMSNGNASTNEYLNKKLAPSSKEQIASGTMKAGNARNASYGNNNAGYVARQIIAPMPNASSNKPATTSNELLNKITMQNQENLKKQQEQNKKIDWIDSLKDGYDFGDVTKTVLGAVGFGEHSRKEKPIEVNTENIEAEYNGYTKEQLQNEQKKIQEKLLTYSKNGAKPVKDKDGHYTLSGIWNTMTGKNAKELKNDKEYIELQQRDNVLIQMIQEDNLRNKKYDKGLAGFAEKSNDVLVGGMAKGARGMEGTVKKIIGKENTISEKTYMEKYSEKAMSEANGKVEKALLEMQGSIGQMAPQMVAPGGKAATALGFANYGGSAYNEAKEQGYTEEQATKYGIVNGTLEMALNKVLPSFKVGGKNVYGKTVTDNLTKKIMTKTLGNEAFKRLITDATGEFTEEYLQEFLDPIVRESLLEENNGVGIIKGKNASEIASNIANYTAKNFFSKENLRAGILGALNSGLMGTPSALQANAYTKTTGRSSETGLTQNEQAVVDNIVENRVEELKKSKDKVTKKDISKIEQEVRQDLERGYIETNDIERALSNEEWTKHDNVVKQKEQLENQIKELESKTPQDYKTMGELNSSNEELSRLKEQLSSIDTDTTRSELNSAMNGKITDKDTLLQRAYGEEIEKQNAYQFDKNEKITGQIKKINEDIKKLGLNNNIKTRDAIDILKKVSNETGRQYRLVNNNSTEVQTEYKKIAEKIAKMDNISMEEALKQTENLLIDGFVSDGQVFINVESNNLMRAITGHETTHLFEGTEDYKKLQKIAFKYAETKGEYNSRRKSLEKRYRGIENAKIDNELTSDLVGDYLFSDIEFVRNLSTEQPNIFNKMYNYVKHLYNMATAGSKEARQLEQLKYNFEKVYRENNQSKASNNTKLMASRIEQSIENNSKIEYNKDGNLNKYKSSTLFNQMMLKSKPGIAENVVVNDLKNTYVVAKNEENDYDIKLRVDNLEYNKHKKYYKEVLDYVKGRKETFNNVISNKNEFRPDNNNNDNGEIKETWVEFADRILEQYERDGSTNNYEKGNRNNGELESSFSNTTKYSISNKDSDVENYIKEKGFEIKDNGNLIVNNLTNKQINDLVKIYKTTGYDDVSSDFLRSRLQDGNMAVMREVADRFIEKELGYKPKYDTTKIFEDAEGNKLTKEQVEFFKDSGVRDIRGRLIPVYHRTNSDFTVFDKSAGKQHGNIYGKGFYFSITPENYGNNTMKVYLNAKDGDFKYIPSKGYYVVQESNQIKNVDNASPSSNPDIRYSISDKGELQDNKGNSVKIEASDVGNTGTLMAIHNLNEGKLKAIIELGGFPVPSIAVTNPGAVNHNQYGDISVLFDKSTIDPAISANEVYDRDVWSPTFPQVDYNLDSEQLKTVSDRLGIRSYDLEDYADNNKTPEYLSDRLTRVDEVVNKYVEDNNIQYETTYKNPELRVEFNELSNDIQQFVIDNDLDVFKLVNDNNLKNEYFKLIKEYYDNSKLPEQAKQRLYEEKIEQLNNFIDAQKGAGDNFVVRGFTRYQNDFDAIKNGLSPVVDEWQTQKNKREAAINNGLKEYLIEEVQPLFSEKGIYNGKEYLTPSGNRRSFWQLHDEYNLENIVDAMTKGDTKGTQNWIAGFGQIQAQMATQFNSIDEIRAAQGQLMPDANNTRLVELRSKLEADLDSLAYKHDGWNGMEIASELVADFASKKTHDIETFRKLLRTNYQTFRGITDSEITQLIEDLEQLRDLPTDYFEAKPQRAVGLDEIQQLVIPNTTDAEFKQQLQDLGIKYTEYDPSIEGDRQRVINQYDNLKFMLSSKNDIAPITDNRNIRARDMLLPRQQEIQKAIAPIQEENKVLKQEVETLKKEVKDIRENNAITQEEFEQENRRIAPLLKEQEAPPEIEQVYDNLKDTTRMPKKELKMLSKNIKDTLGLTNKQKLDLEGIIQDYSTSETATREDLYNDIKNRYGKQAIITEYEDIRNVQTKVKSMKLDVSDNIKHSIADYNKLKQKNFGKISFSRNGQPVDVVYQELNAEYPNYFPDNIYNETDQFQKIVDVANLENKSVEEFNLDDNYIRETSDYIYESILDSKQDALQKEVEKTAKKSMQGELLAPMPEEITNTEGVSLDSIDDEIRLMEHKAQKKAKSNKKKTTRTPLDFGTLDEIENRVKSKQNGELIEALNQMDSETENKSIEAQKKIKSKNESKLKKAKTYAQYLATNRNVEIDNYAKETGNHNIQVLADHINNVQGEITTNINSAQTDNNGNTIGKGIAQIFSQADKAGLSEGFNDYLFHLSNVERHKWGKGSQIPMNDSLALIDEYEKTYPEMKSWAKEVNQYNKNLLYKQADAGLITKELADGLSKRYEFYVPFMENLDGEYTPDSTNQIKTRSTVKSARGGANRNLLDFEEAMIKQTQSAISQIRKNQLYQEIVKTKENSTTDFDTNTNPDIQDNGLFNDNGKYYLTAYVDGKATQVEIDKSLYHGLSQNGNRIIRQVEQKLAPITKPLQAIGNIRRNILTTWSPTFLITNPLKDLQDAPLNSKYAKDFSKNVPKAFKEMFTGKGEHLESFLNMYGQANLRGDYNLDSGLSDITKLVDKKTNSEASNKGIGVSKKLLKKIPQINEMIEMAPRYAEYLASLENGCSQMEALYNAREVTTNFGRGGIITKALNRNGFTFLNASVQGMSKLVRNFSGENGGRAVVGCIAKATTLGIAPALLNALLFGDDDDYEVIPDYIKDNYYLIKTSDNDFIRIPKGRMMSIFGSAARRALEGVQGREKPFEGYLSNAYNQVGVQNPSESNIFAPLIQAKNNKTWYGTDLVPKRLQTNKKDGTKIPAKDQYDASTDKMSIWLGKKLNISPYKINYVIDQYSGGIGDMVLPTMTEEAQSKSDSVIGKMIAPLKDKFSADSTTDNKYVTNFYSKLEELGEKKNATGSKKDEMSYNYMQNISYEMGALYKEMREVQANKKLADSKKYAKVQNIKAEINKLAEEGMKGYKDVEAYNNYARVGNRELYKYQSKNGETGWSDSNGKYADDINNLGLSIKEKDEYYTTKMKLSDVANRFKENEGSEKYRAVLKTIRNSKLTSDAKYELYNSWYGKNDETSSVVQDLGISANDYLKFKTADLTSDKNKNGYAIRGSKANKITKYLNKTDLDTGQKAILYRLAFSYKGSYSSSKYSNAYNQEIVNYINNSNLTYDESENALKKLGFKVSKDGTIKW